MSDEKKYVSLTFDDGPCVGSPDSMSAMLDLLEKNNVVGSFFVIGNKITEENKKVIKRAFDMGCDIQNHSWSHPPMADLSIEEIQEEYDKCDKAIIEITGKKPEFFRPPYISVGENMYKAIKVPFICGKGCQDWEPKVLADERIRQMKEGAEDGTLYLLHVMEGNVETYKAVEVMIPWLKEQGYTFVTVPQMFEIKKQNGASDGSLWSVVK